MKRFFLAALAVAAIASCAKNEVNEVSDNNQITFQTVVGPNTKALIDGETYATTDPSFGTFAYYNATGETFPTSADLYIPESEVEYNNSLTAWTTATPYYWPKNGSLTFFSYSPYDELTSKMDCNTTNGLILSDWDVDTKQVVDVMVADRQTGKTQNETNGTYSGVPTIFRHKLSQIVNVTFKTDRDYANGHDGTSGKEFVAGDKQFFINYVKINNLEQTGTYTSGNDVSDTQLGSWDLPTTPDYNHNYEWFKETTPCDTKFTNVATDAKTLPYLLVMPQTYKNFTAPDTAADVSNVEIQYTIRTYTDASNYSDDVVTAHVSMYEIFSSSSNALAMNKKVTINFTIGVNQIYWAPSVAEWGTETGAATII